MHEGSRSDRLNGRRKAAVRACSADIQDHENCNDLELGGGVATTIVLPQNTMQLSNKGGEIRLVDRTERTVHLVTYSKSQAERDGETRTF